MTACATAETCFASNLTPVNPVEGDLWFDTQATTSSKIWDGSGFTTVGGGSGGGAATVSPTAPALPAMEALWYDTAAGFLKVYLAASAFNGCQLR